MKDFNARHFMEQAIDAMRKSIAERRDDGKYPPKVGAVLVDVREEVPPNSRVSMAFRGELREGDHAEFTLLERKHRASDLSNCVLFATLEPCAPKARRFPKLSTLPAEIQKQLNDSERQGWQWLSTQGSASTPEYAKAMGVDNRTGRRHLQHFVELNLARVRGAGRATRYEVI